jgi:hypothetical protein
MMSAPDYLSPIVGYRAWQWDDAGLRSLNGESWRPGEPLEARCTVSEFAQCRRCRASHCLHDAPQLKCTCGIYASNSLEHLRWPGYGRSLVYGQVQLWGTLVEHERGWRAQYAYPQRFILTPEALPVTLVAVKARLQVLTAYRCVIFVVDQGRSIFLWNDESGYTEGGLKYLISRAEQWYVRRKQGSAIRRGDRIAVPRQGIAVVEEFDDACIRAKLGNQVVRMAWKQVSWNKQNLRWEIDEREYRTLDGNS